MTKEEKESKSIRKYLKKVRKAKREASGVSTTKRSCGASVLGASIKMAAVIKKRMNFIESSIVTLRRCELSQKFGVNIIRNPERGKVIIKTSVRNHLRNRGIKVKYGKGRFNGLVDFIKIEEE